MTSCYYAYIHGGHMTAPILSITSTDHRRHSIPPTRHANTLTEVCLGQLARDVYVQGKATNEMLDRISQENARMIALIEECDQRISNLGARIRRLEDIILDTSDRSNH